MRNLRVFLIYRHITIHSQTILAMHICTSNHIKLFSAGRHFKLPGHFRFVFMLLLLASATMLYAQQTIRGRVTGEGGTAIAGATVQVKGSTTATQTDANGQYTINAPANATLVISFVGYEPLEIKPGNQANVNVELRSATGEMQQVVVVGYGTQRKATLTGSVTSVKGAEITKSPTMNVSNSLAGRLPGLVTVTPSGEPGYDGTVLRIRGVNTLGNNDPLIVVDGVPGRSLERLDPNTIESVPDAQQQAALASESIIPRPVTLHLRSRLSIRRNSLCYSLLFQDQCTGRPRWEFERQRNQVT
jgi:hypothetical protein